MSYILIDYEKIITGRLKLSFSPAPKAEKDFSPGLVILVTNDTLSSLKLGKNRIKYIEEFIGKVTEYYYIMYNQKREICVIDSGCNLQRILPALVSGLPSKTLIFVRLDLVDKKFSAILNTLISNGFTSPYISRNSIVLSKQNISDSDTISRNDIVNGVIYAIEQYKENNNTCYLYAMLSERATRFLKKIPITSEKELTGELYVKDIVRNSNNKIVYIVDVDNHSVKSGREENVNVSATRYNFHSHPRKAYIRYSINKAWPSVTDYLGYLKLGRNTIFHCVATIEGVYIMSFSAYWGANLHKVCSQFIDKNFEIDHSENYTPTEYVEKINLILYKKYPIFELKYFPWKKANTIFKVFFPRTDLSCLPSEQIVKKYLKSKNAL